jgi:hypothetical protein
MPAEGFSDMEVGNAEGGRDTEQGSKEKSMARKLRVLEVRFACMAVR